MLPVTRAQFERAAHDVHVLWDEAQSDPALLRFLAPFGRPDLSRLARTFAAATSAEDVITEAHPAQATWLATLLARELKGVPPMRVGSLTEPRWDSRLLMPSLEFTLPFFLGQVGATEFNLYAPGHRQNTTGPSRLATLVVAGSLSAPSVVVNGGCLVVAGDLDTKVLVANGCVLVGGTVRADVVLSPATMLGSDRLGFHLPRALGFQVGRSIECLVFDSPRFALTCPVNAQVVLRAVNLASTPDATLRAEEVLGPGSMRGDAVNLAALITQ